MQQEVTELRTGLAQRYDRELEARLGVMSVKLRAELEGGGAS